MLVLVGVGVAAKRNPSKHAIAVYLRIRPSPLN